MENNTQQGEISDYDTEWELDTDSSDSASSGATGGDQPTLTSDDQFDEGASEGNDHSPTNDQSHAAVQDEVDVWAGASEAQMEAFRRAENEKTAAENRAKINADKLAERGRELKTLRDESLELQEATRVRSEFETEHEVYARDVDLMIQRRLDERIPEAPVVTEAENDQYVYEAITNAHPTAGDMYNSEPLKELLADDPVFKHNGRAVLFSETLHSNDPADVIAALDFYKTTHQPVQQQAAPTGLESMQGASSRGGRPDMRTMDQFSDSERYDAEWELDDD